jgi:hypothetical protein
LKQAGDSVDGAGGSGASDPGEQRGQLLTLTCVERGQELILGRLDLRLEPLQRPLAARRDRHHLASLILGIVGALDQAGFLEVGDDCSSA